MNRPWIAFFSQTGSEIVEVSKLLGRWPDMIVTNERPEHLRNQEIVISEIDENGEYKTYWDKVFVD